MGPANANACVMCRLTTKYWWVLNQRSLSVFGMCLLFVFGTAFSIYRMRYGMRAESAPEGGEKKNTILPIVQPSIASSLLHLFYHQSWCVWFSSIYFFHSVFVRSLLSFLFTFDLVDGFWTDGVTGTDIDTLTQTPFTWMAKKKYTNEIRQYTCLTMIWIEMFVKTWKWNDSMLMLLLLLLLMSLSSLHAILYFLDEKKIV